MTTHTSHALLRRIERVLGEDPRTAELGIHVRLCPGGLVAQGQVMSQQRRAAVLEVIHGLEPDVEVVDQIAVTGEHLAVPTTAETVPAPPHGHPTAAEPKDEPGATGP